MSTSEEHPLTRLRVVDRPLTAAELSSAAVLLPRAADATALVALALPVGLLPDAALAVDGHTVRWRGATLGADELTGPEAVARWAASVWRPGEMAAVPEGPLWTWVRPVRSGSGVVVWGPAALWDGPEVHAAATVPLEVVYDTLRRWWAGEDVSAPALVETDGGVVFVDGDDTTWRFGAPGAAPVPDVPDDTAVAELVAAAAAAVNAAAWTIDRPRRRAPRWVVRLDLGAWKATFDVVAHPGSLQVGRRAALGEVPDGLELPEGWAAASAAGTTVCARSHDGLWALLEPAR